jgi:hypothetical protein
MKRYPVILLLFVVGCSTAEINAQEPSTTKDPAAPRPAPVRVIRQNTIPLPPEEANVWRELATADVKNIQLDVITGGVEFTVGEVTYYFGGYPNREVGPAALAELRRVKKFKVPVPASANDKQSKRIYISQLIVLYDDLIEKPAIPKDTNH